MASRLDNFLQLISYVAIAAIIALSLVPGSARPQTGAPGYGEHVFAYFLTAFLFGLRSTSVSQLIKLGLIFIAGGGVLEAAQMWVPGRNSQVTDFMASSLGILAGLAIGGAFGPIYRKLLLRLR